MTSPFKTKKFLELRDKWYTKLEKSGFVDAEQDEDNLKQWDSYSFSGSRRARYNKDLYSSKEEYYQLAGKFLNSYEFKTKKERLIWECHAEGKTVTETSEILRKKNFKSCSRSRVHDAVSALAKEMLKSNAKNN